MISFLIYFRDLLIRSKLVSSAKWWTFLFLIETCKSLIKIMNNSGPKTEPWGTPYITFSEVEFVSAHWFKCIQEVPSLSQNF